MISSLILKKLHDNRSKGTGMHKRQIDKHTIGMFIEIHD